MSPRQAILFLGFLLLYIEFARTISALPLSKPAPRDISFPSNSTLPGSRVASNDRKARLFGKLSLIAGVGLPEPSAAERNDEGSTPLQVASYNFPPSRWGPYFAAVYEPALALFLRNPLGYIANLLNPLNWFAGLTSPASGGAETTITGQTDARPEDNVVLVVHDTDETSAGKVEMKMEPPAADKGNKTRQETVRDEVTITSRTDKDSEPIEEDTTSTSLDQEENEEEEHLEDENRQARPTSSRRPTTRTSRRPTQTRTSVSPTMSATMPTTANSTESAGGNNRTEQTAYPPYPSQQYGYYGGQPQDLSNVDFTTSQADFFAREQQPNFQVNRFAQQQPANLRQSFAFQAYPAFYDYFARADQQPLQDYYAGNEISANSIDAGFQPVFPYYNNF